MGTEGTYLSRVKSIYGKPTANIILNGEKLNGEKKNPKIKNKTRVSTFTTIIQHSSGSPTTIRDEKEIKEDQIGKEEVKPSLFADDMIMYMEKPKDSIRKVLELISEFSKVAGYKTSTQKSLAFLYTNNEKSEREIKESIPFTIATRRI